MKCFVGLGNPGEKYRNNRHNVGFMVLDKLVGDEDWDRSKSGKLFYCWTEVGGKEVELVKPQTFMNSSGEVVAYVRAKHPKLEMNDLYVVYDDLDLRLGKYKIQKGKGPKEHKGLLSIYDVLGTEDFWHVRVGVDNRLPDNRIDGETYVLQDFTTEEFEVLENVFERLTSELYDKLKYGQGN